MTISHLLFLIVVRGSLSGVKPAICIIQVYSNSFNVRRVLFYQVTTRWN